MSFIVNTHKGFGSPGFDWHRRPRCCQRARSPARARLDHAAGGRRPGQPIGPPRDGQDPWWLAAVANAAGIGLGTDWDAGVAAALAGWIVARGRMLTEVLDEDSGDREERNRVLGFPVSRPQ
jgi:hypothetical protein